MCYCYCEAEVRSSSVCVVYVVRLHIVFSKAALQKRVSMDQPLRKSTTSFVNKVSFISDERNMDQFYNCLKIVVLALW